MAIFSFNHSFIGRTTSPPGAAANFAKYITRPGACTTVVAERMPTERGKMMSWLDSQEQGDRKNARVIDKLIVALPSEFTREQNVQLLTGFCERLTEGRASWAVAIHDGPGDADNPHAHIIIRDRDVETGRRVIQTTEAGSTFRLREAWARDVNAALEIYGFEQRVDHRSLEAQGVDREPQLHVGAGATELGRLGHQFQGQSRFDENEAIKDRNRLRAIDNGQYPYAWTTNATMVAQQEAALLWNAVAQKRAESLALSTTEQLSAMAWVRTTAKRAEELFNGGHPFDPDNASHLDELYESLNLFVVDRKTIPANEVRGASMSDEPLSQFAQSVADSHEERRNRSAGLEM